MKFGALAFAWPAILLPALITACGGSDGPAADSPAAAPCVAGRACVTTLAGSGEMGNVDGPAAAARFWFPHAVAVDAQGAVHVADYGNANLARKVGRDGMVSTPPANEVEFAFPSTLAVDAAGNRYVVQTELHRIVRIAPDGTQTVVAGSGASGAQDGDAATASFSLPEGVALDGAGRLYVADTGNSRVRMVTLAQP